jgi:uncharacterized protein YecT (DUF1311 family)
MQLPFLHSLVIASVLVAASVARSDGRSGSPHIPASVRALWGTWDVEQVAVDVQERAHWTFEPNDPRLLGRTLVLDEEGVNFNALEAPCAQSRWTSHASSWATVLATGFPRSGSGKHGSPSRPADFDLNVTANATLAVFPICEEPLKRRALQPHLSGKWIAAMGDDKLVVGFDGAALLLLKRRSSEAKATASFACTDTHTLTESAICQSYELAAWDRSVAAAWRGAYKKTSTPAALLEEQKLWLRKRDACGAHMPCIAQQLRERVTQLSR